VSPSVVRFISNQSREINLKPIITSGLKIKKISHSKSRRLREKINYKPQPLNNCRRSYSSRRIYYSKKLKPY